MNIKKLIYTLPIVAGSFMLSCDKEEFEPMTLDINQEVQIKTFEVSGALETTLDEKTKTIHVLFPGGTNIAAIAPSFTVSNGASVTPASGATLDLRVPQTITVLNGNLFGTYKLTAEVQSVTAFLSHHASVNDITDDDEKAYAEWFFNEYESEVAEFVSFQAIKDGSVDLNKYKTLTWYLDGNADESFQMPAIAMDANVLAKVKTYYQGGGNLYLLGYAGRYLIELGRLPSNKYFIEVGNGGGFDNPDPWGVGTAILGKDESTHPIYTDIPLTTNGNRKTFPVIGPGWKENHNYVVIRIPEVYGLPNDSAAAYDKFNQDNNTRWLGVWDGIGDFFMAGVVEFLPNNQYKGRAIFQGIGGIEWDQDAKGTINPDGENPYQSNIEKMGRNAISYLNLN